MNQGRKWNLFLGFGGAIVVFSLLAYFVGVDQIVAAVSQANVRLILLVMLSTLGWLLLWSLALQTVLQILDVELAVWKTFFVFAGATCLNNLTPLGQVGGSPATALLISRTAETDYEASLAGIASVETLNLFPSIILALLSAAYLIANQMMSAKLRYATTVTLVLSVFLPTVLYVGWLYRTQLQDQSTQCIVFVGSNVTRILPRISPPKKEVIRQSVENFFKAIERIAGHKRGLAIAFVYLTLGWVCQMAGLWLAFRAVGPTIPFIVTLFIIPISAIAGVTPLPGGAGGIETVLLGLLLGMNTVMTLDLTEGTIAASIIIFRGAVYWIPVLIGSIGVGVLRADGSL
jgi:glycosyltransferase 2 family protein